MANSSSMTFFISFQFNGFFPTFFPFFFFFSSSDLLYGILMNYESSDLFFSSLL